MEVTTLTGELEKLRKDMNEKVASLATLVTELSAARKSREVVVNELEAASIEYNEGENREWNVVIANLFLIHKLQSFRDSLRSSQLSLPLVPCPRSSLL